MSFSQFLEAHTQQSALDTTGVAGCAHITTMENQPMVGQWDDGSRKMSREEKPSIRERLTQAKEQAAEKTEHRTIDREKVKVKDRSVQR